MDSTETQEKKQILITSYWIYDILVLFGVDEGDSGKITTLRNSYKDDRGLWVYFGNYPQSNVMGKEMEDI